MTLPSYNNKILLIITGILLIIINAIAASAICLGTANGCHWWESSVPGATFYCPEDCPVIISPPENACNNDRVCNSNNPRCNLGNVNCDPSGTETGLTCPHDCHLCQEYPAGTCSATVNCDAASPFFSYKNPYESFTITNVDGQTSVRTSQGISYYGSDGITYTGRPATGTMSESKYLVAAGEPFFIHADMRNTGTKKLGCDNEYIPYPLGQNWAVVSGFYDFVYSGGRNCADGKLDVDPGASDSDDLDYSVLTSLGGRSGGISWYIHEYLLPWQTSYEGQIIWDVTIGNYCSKQMISLCPDKDGDGYFDIYCDGNRGSAPMNDCEDSDARISPGQPEICDDGLDNNCDGMRGTGALNACGTCGAVPAEICNNIDDNCDGTIDEGVKNACGTCGTEPAEICDNIDNDCDGTIDESVTTVCFEGIPPATAGVGTCVSGIATCAAGVFGACTGQVLPIAEICNNIDDDCDGAIDDGCDDDDDDHCDAAMSKQEGLTITVCPDTPASDTEGDDCDDTAAAIHPASTEASTAECTDRKDNDCDALTDCMDSGCAANAACKEQNCADGLDNEGDGKADSYDSADCPACTISDARWTSDLPGNLDIDQRRDGQTAYLVVDGQNCYHRVVDYDLWEQDFLATQFWDDDVWDPFSSPATFLVNTGTLAIPWSAVYDQFSIGSQDSSESGNPEYYFIATVRDSTEDSQSGTLEVTPDTLICPADADNDGYNIAGGGTDCGPIDCDDTEAAINPGKLEICNGIDDDCDGSIDEGGVCAVCVKNPASPDTEICNNLIDDDCNLAIDCDDPYCYTFAGCVAPENCVDLDLVVDANNNYDVQLDTTLCKKRYVLPDTDHSAKEGVLNIIANNIFLDCNEAQLVGDGLGTAIKALDRTGITIRRCNLTNYDNGIKATNSINSWFTENLLSTKHDLLFDASSAGNRMRLNHFYTSGVSDSSSNANFYCPDVGGTPRGNLYNVSIPWGKIGWNDCGPSIFTLPLPDAVITDTINPIQFEWTLQSALTPLGYFLEYSLNGGAWKKIDNLPLGTARTYSWTPPGNLPGLYEIRLKPYEGTTGTGPDYDSWVNATQNITRITYAETATVSGDVTCAQNGNEAVAGATVNITIINADDTETNIWAVTDQYGHYIIYNAPTGSREITANYPGMTRGRKTVEIVSPSTPVEFNTVCPFTLDCETDCTLVNNGVCMPECDGFKSGEEECNIQSLCIGHTKDFTMTNPLDTSQSITCCESMNTLEQGEKAKIEVNADNIATITRIVYYNNKPVRMAVVSWN